MTPTPGVIASLAERVATTRSMLSSRPVHELAELLGSVGERFLDDSDPLRVRALELLPGSSLLSAEMCRLVLDGMARDWTRASLHRLLVEEFGDPAVLDRFVRSGGRSRMAMGPGLCTQIVAGSVPGVGVSALIRSLLTKGPVLLKPGLGDVVLPTLFAEALSEADPEVGDAAAVVYWPGGDVEVERAALARADVVVVYGSDMTIKALRDLTRATARFVAYHHRMSIGIVGRDAGASVANQVANAVAIFDQRGCVSPTIIFVEESGVTSPRDFARLVAEGLRTGELDLPSGGLDIDSAAALHQLRATAEMRAAGGDGEVIHGGDTGAWTVLYEPGGAVPPTGPGRCVSIRPVTDLEALPALLTPFGAHLQTVGYAGIGQRTTTLAERLGSVGAVRLTPFDRVSFPPPWWLHDGRCPLRELVRWVELEDEE